MLALRGPGGFRWTFLRFVWQGGSGAGGGRYRREQRAVRPRLLGATGRYAGRGGAPGPACATSGERSGPSGCTTGPSGRGAGSAGGAVGWSVLESR